MLEARATTKTSVKTKTKKAEQTRAKILEAALALFQKQGYDETTMRAVAERAGVSLGNAYYYFKSKDALLHAYYERMSEATVELAATRLDGVRGLEDRLRALLLTKLEVIEPFHRFSGLLFRTAADPQSPLNPFHETSQDVRDIECGLFAQVLEGSRVRIPKDLAAELPLLLWMHSMGIVLFWIYDASPGRERTKHLIDHTAAMVTRLIKLASNPLLRPLRKSVLKLLAELDLSGTASAMKRAAS